MRTKALLLGAAIGAVSLATSMAQVYSVNIVGYINVNIPGKAAGSKGAWTLIANQLNASGGNTVENLFPAPPTAISIFKFNNTTKGYDIGNYDTDFQQWDIDPPGRIVLNPGEGFFVLNGGTTAWTQTFVGEVQIGTSTINLTKGFQALSVVVPQSGLLQTDLGWVPSPLRGDSIYKYNTATQGYDIYNYDADFQAWDFNGEAIEPSIAVGESFFALRGDEGGTWTRTFNVGP